MLLEGQTFKVARGTSEDSRPWYYLRLAYRRLEEIRHPRGIVALNFISTLNDYNSYSVKSGN